MTIKIAILYLINVFSAKKGGLAIFSLFLTMLSVYPISEFLGESDRQHLAFPIVLQGVFTLIFLVITTFDTITGIGASKKRNSKLTNPRKNVIKSHKLRRMTAKISIVFIVTTMVTLLCLIAEILQSNIGYYTFVWVLVWFWFIVNGYELKSINENTKVIDGRGHDILNFFERILDTLMESGLKRISKTVGGDDYANQYPQDDLGDNENYEDENTGFYKDSE